MTKMMSSIEKGPRRLLGYGAAVAVALLALGAGRTPSGVAVAQAAVATEAAAPVQDEVGRLLERARSADEALQQVEGMYDREIAPIEAVLRSYRDDPELTREIAVALVREAHRANLEPRVLLARIRALLRRYQQPEKTDVSELRFGSLYIQISSRKVTLDEQDVPLSSHEFDLLTTFARQAGKVLSSENLEVRRNFLSPFFQAFDAPIPFTAFGRRSVSNVPAQALALMNDPFVAAQMA